jgi:hypothetical protein
MDNFERHELLVAFSHRRRRVQLTASAKGWAQMYLKQKTWSYSHRRNRTEYEQDILRQVAINSILRDWIKGQVTVIGTGILSFEAVFMPFMLTADGLTLVDWISETNLLPAPEPSKVAQLTGS